MSTIPTLVSRAGHAMAAAVSGKASTGGADQFSQALGKPKPHGGANGWPSRAQPAHPGSTDAIETPGFRIGDTAHHEAAAHGGTVSQLSVLLDTAPGARGTHPVEHTGQDRLNAALARMTASALSAQPDEKERPGIAIADDAGKPEEPEIDISHTNGPSGRQATFARTALPEAAMSDRQDVTGEPKAAFPDPAQVRTDTNAADPVTARQAMAVASSAVASLGIDGQTPRGVPDDEGAAAEAADDILPDLHADAPEQHHEEPTAAVVLAQAAPIIEPRRVAAVRTADAADPATEDSSEAGTSTACSLPDAKADVPARGAAYRQATEVSVVPARAAANDQQPRNTLPAPERATPPPARAAMQEAAPQRADIHPQRIDDGSPPAPKAGVEAPREERAPTLPTGAQTIEPLAGRVTVLPTAITPATSLPMSPTATAFVAALASEATPPQALHEAALAAHTAKPAAPVTLQTLKIQLQPAELGLVTARLTVDGERIAVDLQVETAEARHKMSADSDQIVQALRGMGFDIDRVTVQQSHSAGGANAEARNQPSGFAGQDSHGGDAGERRSGSMDRGQDNEAARDRQGPAAGTGGDVASGGSLYI
ncbi:MAG TPA: flagellar hook-length control protein FliK [Rhizobiaceae bacterium]|nr:flagellar hook-length control protein FliK [Rhizobiaceae bacterium]